ncbi:putative ankyrin repeat domain-containing protein 19 [Manacus vitellinus]|uniref:putative ankyrin repeat domain-containing protein 19 n=1 Tax=Manacus vitellinus TaxID=328815 RepID=UPI00084701D6|nr:putative ankyrin repeat domain-containing protein 19 [Manacus vitellinus]
MKAVQQEQEECVAILLEHGADPNLADAGGNTALHLAVLSKNTAVAGLLLEHNASSDAQNQMGFTPLKLAALLQHEEILECLLKKAADRHAQAQCERTAFVVTGTHEVHLEEDNLRLQEELDRADTEVWKACPYRDKPGGARCFLYIMKTDKTVFWEPVGQRPKEVAVTSGFDLPLSLRPPAPQPAMLRQSCLSLGFHP